MQPISEELYKKIVESSKYEYVTYCFIGFRYRR